MDSPMWPWAVRCGGFHLSTDKGWQNPLVRHGGLSPEQSARVGIDQMLAAAGYLLQDYADIHLRAGDYIAVREYPTATGPVDYMLFAMGKAIGTVEAKPEGFTLLGYEGQADRYAEGYTTSAVQKGLAHWGLPLAFHYLGTGKETRFTSRLDPAPRPRRVFAFHKPQTLVEWAEAGAAGSLRSRVRQMPALDTVGLRAIQGRAIAGIETSIASDRSRTLVAMTMGSGKTFVAIAEAYRLLRHAGARRVLFLVDRINLGEQAKMAFDNWTTPDDGRKLGELYNVQLLRSNHIDPAAGVVITTIQRLYSMLRNEPYLEPEVEEESQFELAEADQAPVEVFYQPAIGIETFDVIFTDECHRSIYGRWGQVLDYFDAFLVGLTATPSNFTYGYFEGNVVADYSHEQSVIDGVNVDYRVYRIKTEIGERGSAISAGEWARIRNRHTRQEAFRQLPDEFAYEPGKLDRDVVAPDQIRTVIRAFRDALPTMFPGRNEVPKTVIFCKSDSHAEDVLDIVRTEFGRGSAFAKKITYRAEGSSQQLIQDFRTDPGFRVAVSVDQIATGTDIRPIECLLFLRMVRSRQLFEQMKGRGVRRISPDDLRSVTGDATDKDHFVIVDAVGITEEDAAWAASRPLDRDPSVPLARLLQDIGAGGRDLDALATTASRLSRLERKLSTEAKDEFRTIADGSSLHDIAQALVLAADPDVHRHAAQLSSADPQSEPSDDEIAEAAGRLIDEAVGPLMRPEVRRHIDSLRAGADQIVDIASRDIVTFSGFASADEARKAVADFRAFIDAHHDEFVALKAYFSQPYGERPSLEDLQALASAIAAPPASLTPERVWRAYEQLESSRVRGSGGRVLVDLVSLVRFATGVDTELCPHKELVRLRFDIWLAEQQQEGHTFSPEQLRWLEMISDHISGSLNIEKADFDLPPMSGEGGLAGAYSVFGDRLSALLAELNGVLST